MGDARIHGEQCPFCGNYGAADWPVCSSCGKYKWPPDDLRYARSSVELGVGSTMVAAVLEGRKAIGIEVDEGYCEAAATRLRALREAQPRLAI